ncbi:MAG TPA: MFS transporter [Blastocatellia bacterium]|nr:MFS transporter [Blastocatellia bacterium]
MTNRSKPVFSSPISVSEILAVTNTHRWTIIGLLFVASLINYFDRATISMALPLLSSEFKLGPQDKGILLSAFFWSYALMQIPMGWLADRINLRWLYAGAFAAWSVAQGLMGLAETMTMLITLRILLGIGESIYLPGGSKVVSLLFTAKERGLPSGIFDFGTRTGLVLEGLIVPWCLYHYGWRRTFLIVGFSGLLWLIPWLLATPRRLQGNGGSKSAGGASPATVQQLRSVLRSRNLLGICLGFFCFDYYWYLLVTWLPDYLVTVRHLTVLKAGFYSSLPFFVFGVSEPIGGWIADRLVRKGWDETRTRKAVVTVAFATGLLLIPAAIVRSPGAAVALIIGGSLVGLATGNLLVILQSCAPPNDIGLWTGVENFVGNLAGILAPLATGFLINWTGSYFPGFALAAIVLVAGLISYWFIVGELKPPG